eukprot:g6708.t1
MTDCNSKRKRTDAQELKAQGQKHRKTLLHLLAEIDKAWLPPEERTKFNEKLVALQKQKTKLESRSTALNQSIRSIFNELSSLANSLNDPDRKELALLLETLNKIVSLYKMETDFRPLRDHGNSKGVDVFLAFCRLLGLCTIISALLCMTAHGMAFVVGPPVFQDLTSFLQQSLRVYGIVCSLLTVLVESEWQRFMVQIRLLENWVARSLFQFFLVVLTVHSAVSNGDDDYHKSLQLYRKISGICLLTCAGIYLLGGFLCLGHLKQSRMRRIVEQGKLEDTLHRLEMQEKEIRRTLSKYSSV